MHDEHWRQNTIWLFSKTYIFEGVVLFKTFKNKTPWKIIHYMVTM